MERVIRARSARCIQSLLQRRKSGNGVEVKATDDGVGCTLPLQITVIIRWQNNVGDTQEHIHMVHSKPLSHVISTSNLCVLEIRQHRSLH